MYFYKHTIHFLVYALVCAGFCGCVNRGLTEQECLAMLSAAGYTINLSEPIVAGSIVNNPNFLIGTWQCDYESEGIGVVGFFDKKVKKMGESFIREIYDFKADNTYSRIEYKSVKSGRTSDTQVHNYEGIWSLNNFELNLIENETGWALYGEHDQYKFASSYKNVKRQMRVGYCGNNEISIEYASCKVWREAREAMEKTRIKAYKQVYFKRMVGFDNRDYSVERTFIYDNNSKGWMNLCATTPKRYKYLGKDQKVSHVLQQNELKTSGSDVGGHPLSEPAYTLEALKWEEDNDFACLFNVRMKGECTLAEFSRVRKAFVDEIREIYLQMHPNSDRNSLRIDTRPNLENGIITGRAVVLTIERVSLSYDAYSRKGTLSVRFRSGQYEEARSWLIKNIETLVVDKNIVLVTGEHPPLGQYRLIGERIKDGNIIEIEFKTE